MSKILYVDMDNVLVDFPSAFPYLSPETLQKYKDRLDEVPGIFALMEPLPQAIASPAQQAIFNADSVRAQPENRDGEPSAY